MQLVEDRLAAAYTQISGISMDSAHGSDTLRCLLAEDIGKSHKALFAEKPGVGGDDILACQNQVAELYDGGVDPASDEYREAYNALIKAWVKYAEDNSGFPESFTKAYIQEVPSTLDNGRGQQSHSQWAQSLSGAFMSFVNGAGVSIQEGARSFISSFVGQNVSTEQARKMVRISDDGGMVVKCPEGNITGRVLAKFMDEGETTISCRIKDKGRVNGVSVRLVGQDLKIFLSETLGPIHDAFLRGSDEQVDFTLGSKNGVESCVFMSAEEVKGFGRFIQNNVYENETLDEVLRRFNLEFSRDGPSQPLSASTPHVDDEEVYVELDMPPGGDVPSPADDSVTYATIDTNPDGGALGVAKEGLKRADGAVGNPTHEKLPDSPPLQND